MPNLAETLLIKPESRVLLLNAPIGYAKKLQPLPEGVTIADRRSETPAEVAIVFVRDTSEVKRFQSGFVTLEEDAALWICYPSATKGGASVTPDVLHAALAKDELTQGDTIAFDESWSCTRFSSPEDDASER